MSKKSLLMLMLIPAIIFAETTIQQTYKFEKPQVINGEMFMKGCHTSRQLFAPKVAVKPVVLALEKDHKAVSFEVDYGRLITMDGQYHIKPLRPNVDIKRKPHPAVLKLESDIYNTNEFYPGKVRSNGFRMQYKNGVPLFIALLNPVQINPVTGMIQYYESISVTVQTVKTRSHALYNCTPATKSMLVNLVDNKEAILSLPLTTKDENDYEYLVISRTDLKDNWGDLINFNKRRGLRTKIQTIDYIKSNSTGRDDAEKVRSYIIDEYKNSSIVYVVLGGDVNPGDPTNVPDRLFRSVFYDHHISPDKYHDEKDIAADMYFACLDGDWKTDSNGVEQDYFGDFGTEDFYWEVYASRMPIENATELGNVLNKTIKYSEQPVIEGLTNILMLGNFLWDDYGVAVWGGDHMDEYMGTCTNNGYTTYGFPTNVWSIDRLYEKIGQWNASELRNKVNSFKPSFIEHEGHGNNTYAFEETCDGVTLSNYKNDGSNANFFILSTGACYPGNFNYEYDCLMESFLEKFANGAVATQAFDPTGLEDDDGTDGSGQRIRRFFHDAIFNPQKGMHYLEMAHSNGKEANAEIMLTTTLNDPPYHAALRFISYGFNVFGDPALSVWTKTPQNLQPDMGITGKVFTADTKNPLTWVALCDKDGNIFTTQLTGVDGKCKIDDQVLAKHIEDHPDEKIVVRMKAYNHYPFEGEVDPTSILNNANMKSSFVNSLHISGKKLRINYTLKLKGLVNISIYNSKGKMIGTIVNEFQNAGMHNVAFNNTGLGNGIYYCTVKAGSSKAVNKFVIVK